MASEFKWTENREKAALSLAKGETRAQAAEAAGVSERSIYSWQNFPEFVEEVDRLSLMVEVASRAYRLRIANRAIKQFVQENESTPILTSKDILEWLKYAQSETDGVKLDLLNLLNAYQSETEA